MTNKASRSSNHVRFNKHVPPAPKKRKKTTKKEVEISPYVSDLSKTPSLKRGDKLKFRKMIWVFCVIFLLAGLDQAVPAIRETVSLAASKAPAIAPEVSGFVKKAEGFFNKTQGAVLLMDTVGYASPSHLEDPVIHLVSGMDLIVLTLQNGWAEVSSDSVEFSFWVDKNSLLLD